MTHLSEVRRLQEHGRTLRRRGAHNLRQVIIEQVVLRPGGFGARVTPRQQLRRHHRRQACTAWAFKREHTQRQSVHTG
jgi:hypothetical protein